MITYKELNLRQRRWIELIKNYNGTIEYHSRKVNVVADALKRKSTTTLVYFKAVQLPLMVELRTLDAELSFGDYRALLASFESDLY